MKLTSAIYGRRALGKALPELFGDLGPLLGVSPKISLLSRAGRAVLSEDEIVDAARLASSGTCSLRGDRGAVDIRWSYGPNAGAQTVYWTSRSGFEDTAKLIAALRALCRTCGAIYGYCDTKRRIDRDLVTRGGRLWSPAGFYDLYWLNFFGSEFANVMSVAAGAIGTSSIVEPVDRGYMVRVGGSPNANDPAALEQITIRWPVFARHAPGAGFTPPIPIDYSEVRRLPAPISQLATIGSVVGSSDHFIATVEEHAKRFRDWADGQGMLLRSEEDFRRALGTHGPIVRDQLLVPAIAAYGEMLRHRMRGAWGKPLFFHRDEPVILRAGQPWTARRVVLEVLQLLGP